MYKGINILVKEWIPFAVWNLWRFLSRALLSSGIFLCLNLMLSCFDQADFVVFALGFAGITAIAFVNMLVLWLLLWEGTCNRYRCYGWVYFCFGRARVTDIGVVVGYIFALGGHV